MAAGRHDKRVTIERSSETRDAMGGGTATWTAIAKRWAQIEDLGGRELYLAQQVSADVSTQITLRENVDGLKPNDRIVYGSRTFNIASVAGANDRVYKRGQILLCTQEVQP